MVVLGRTTTSKKSIGFNVPEVSLQILKSPPKGINLTESPKQIRSFSAVIVVSSIDEIVTIMVSLAWQPLVSVTVAI